MKVGLLCSQVRLEEKLILQALRARGFASQRIDVRQLACDWRDALLPEYDVVLVRCLSHTRALYATRVLEDHGVRTVNSHTVIGTCGDKVMTTMALVASGVPTPRAAMGFSQASALAAVEQFGYPVVLKPPVGSWGRLMAKVNDREAAEAVVEHQSALNRADEAPFYVQEYIDKPGRDIRTLVVGDETVYAIYRSSPHWITNTARGGEASQLPVTAEIDRLSRAAAAAVGGEMVAVDLLERADGSLLVNEVNHTPEFHGAMEATDMDIAGRMVDYLISVAREPAQSAVSV
jgi:[lysine-biosynthesis-protein LysW]--L-2-aminoadipate ligase